MNREGRHIENTSFHKGEQQVDGFSCLQVYMTYRNRSRRKRNKQKQIGFPQIIKDLNSRLRFGMEKEWPWKYL